MERKHSRINRRIIGIFLAAVLALTACSQETSTWSEEITECVTESQGHQGCFSVAGIAIYLNCRLEAYEPMMAMFFEGMPLPAALELLRTEGLCPNAPQANTG